MNYNFITNLLQSNKILRNTFATYAAALCCAWAGLRFV